MRIGEAAAICDVEPHVLRHWESMGVVVPVRSANGHREYSDRHISQIQRAKIAKVAGLSLEQIRIAVNGTSRDQAQVIDMQLRLLESRTRELEMAKRILHHAATCSYEADGYCDECDSIHEMEDGSS